MSNAGTGQKMTVNVFKTRQAKAFPNTVYVRDDNGEMFTAPKIHNPKCILKRKKHQRKNKQQRIAKWIAIEAERNAEKYGTKFVDERKKLRVAMSREKQARERSTPGVHLNIDEMKVMDVSNTAFENRSLNMAVSEMPDQVRHIPAGAETNVEIVGLQRRDGLGNVMTQKSKYHPCE